MINKKRKSSKEKTLLLHPFTRYVRTTKTNPTLPKSSEFQVDQIEESDMPKNLSFPLLVVIGLFAAACTLTGKDQPAGKQSLVESPQVAEKLMDGEITVPSNYREWPKFLTGIDKVDGKQIRDIYISPNGHQTRKGEPFPDGTISVMEIWKAKTTADGTLLMSGTNSLIKDELSLIFVMAKSAGAGDLVDPALQNGDWVYAGYKADGKTPGGPPAAACRSCHLQEAGNDWVFRYDEYFAKRDN